MDVDLALLRRVEAMVGAPHHAVEILDLENGFPTVLRVHFGDVVRTRDASVVVKRAARFDPADGAPVPKTAWALFNEWTALTSLEGSGVAPRLLGADSEVGLLVMEDLGAVASLEDHLMGSDARSAERALISLARSVGVMHAAGMRHSDSFQRHRDSLGPGGTLDAYLSVGNALHSFVRRCRRLDLLVDGTAGDIEQIATALGDPKEWRGLLHADLGPGNVLVNRDRAYLIDFETAGLGYAPIEVMTFRCLFQQVEVAFRLPAGLVEDLERVYQQSLVDAGYNIDVERFADAKVIAAAFLAMAGTEEDLSLLDRQQAYIEPDRLKSRLRYRLNTFARLAAARQLLPNLVQTVTRLLGWLPKGEDLPVYPVFHDR